MIGLSIFLLLALAGVDSLTGVNPPMPDICGNPEIPKLLAEAEQNTPPGTELFEEGFLLVYMALEKEKQRLEEMGVENSLDLIHLLSQSPNTNPFGVVTNQIAVHMLKEEHVHAFVDTLLKFAPQFPKDLLAFRQFLDTPEGKPLRDAIMANIRPVVLAYTGFFIQVFELYNDVERNLKENFNEFSKTYPNPEALLLLPFPKEITKILEFPEIYERNLAKARVV